MSRSGYTDDFGYDEPWRHNLYRGRVRRSIAGKRGQKMLRELAAALDAMPVKALVPGSFQRCDDGKVCTLGCLLRARGVDTSELEAAIGDDPDYAEDVSQEAADAVGVARPMAAEIMYLNDEHPLWNETDAERWTRMRRWVQSEIRGGP